MNSMPEWQLPPGCSRGLWDYAHSPMVAEDYDAYFAHHKLLEFDQRVLRQWVDARGRPGQLIADLGCGTGRALVPLVRAGYRGLAVDFSSHMLREVARKAEAEQLDIVCREANWVELDGVADNSVDHCLSMFSTLGMIRGGAHRLSALRHTRRILRPGGQFVLHVHNLWHNARDPGGLWWIARSALKSLRRDWEFGDKYFPYRGVPQMYLHVFTRRELRKLLHAAGFQVREWVILDSHNQGPLSWAPFLPALRGAGWIVRCE